MRNLQSGMSDNVKINSADTVPAINEQRSTTDMQSLQGSSLIYFVDLTFASGAMLVKIKMDKQTIYIQRSSGGNVRNHKPQEAAEPRIDRCKLEG